MTKNPWRITRISLEWGTAIAALVALLQGAGAIRYASDMALVLLGGGAATIAVFEHGWHRAPTPIGTPIKTAIILVSIWGALIFVGYEVHPIEQPKRDAQSNAKGFMQFGEAWFHTKEIAVNKELSLSLWMKNNGGEPVYNMYPYFAVSLAPLGTDEAATDLKTHADMLRDALLYQAQMLNEGKNGKTLGKGEGLWESMTIPPLTDYQAKGILNGRMRLYVYEWARWRDAPHDLDTCLWLQPPPTPDVSDFKQLIWHPCSE
jgi:hypothetical protein